MPFFSIIIPFYNRGKFLQRALDSLLVQTFKDFEVILVDDASTDNSLVIAKEFNWPHKKIIENETNQERCISRNEGIAKAKGEYICFLDSDDYHLPNHLQVIHSEIKLRDFPRAFFFTNAWNGINSELKERVCPDLGIDDIYNYLLTYTPNPQRWAVHKSLFNNINFDKTIPGLEDLDLLLRAVKYMPFIQIKKRTTVYVQHEGSYTLSNTRAKKELKNLHYIFSNPEIKTYLPIKTKRRLISMCHYHLAMQNNTYKKRKKLLYHGFSSFWLYPKGYNGKTNKILLTTLLYNIPIIGSISRMIVRNIKNTTTLSNSEKINV